MLNKFYRRIVVFLLILTFLAPFQGMSQNDNEFNISGNVTLNWQSNTSIVRGNMEPLEALFFDGAVFAQMPENHLPVFVKKVQINDSKGPFRIELNDLKFIPLTLEETNIIVDPIPTAPETSMSIMSESGKIYAFIEVMPFGVDPATNQIAKLVSFSYSITLNSLSSDESLSSVSSFRSDESYNSEDIATLKKDNLSMENRAAEDIWERFSAHSKLAMGDWYKLWVTETGVHIITFDDMRNMGINMNSINPDYISMFGKGGSMLPEKAGENYKDDLTEISIRVVTANEGIFSPGDYILFYGEGPLTWKYNTSTGRITHENHLYADKIGYFLTIGNIPGKRLPKADPVTATANKQSFHYTALAHYGKENFNLIKSGRKWFSDKFDTYTRTLNLPSFSFSDVDGNSQVQMGYGFAGRATEQMTFEIKVNGKTENTTTIAKWANENEFAKDIISNQSFKSTSDNFQIQVQFNPPNSAAIGWLDFISLNVRSKLKFMGGQMSFRDPVNIGEVNITEYTIESSVNEDLELWDVTNHSYVHQIPLVKSGNKNIFRVHTPYLREFVVFDKTKYLNPQFAGKVANQDLHAMKNFDMIIVTHPMFNKQAQKLATLHNNRGEITAKVVLLPEIYNEFSSGHEDITAIRDFMKMLYHKGQEYGYPKYLLLFGNASYDYKNRIHNNINIVPTFQSNNSVSHVSTYLSDDYFGLLDDGEGTGEKITGLLDVGIGRLPVRTQEQADDVMDKLETYLTKDPTVFGDWRNNLLIISDDQDRNIHLNQAERLCVTIDQEEPLYNVNKIYFDAYRQNNTPGGGRYPDVNREINSLVDKGALITNYIGHGGELGWADERVLEISDIQAWRNFKRMGLFFTATCEFSRFDDPQHTSAGELVFLNPQGGAVAMITTTRLAYAALNEYLNDSFIDTVLKKNGNIPRLGDIIKYTKNDNKVSANQRHITLFGDPAMPMLLPKYNVVTTSIVDPATLLPIDTLSANTKATIQGEIHDLNDNLITGFNGEVSVKVFDKVSTIRTLGQDSDSFEADFQVRNSVIYQGKATVTNGLFNITFPVPRDIDYNYGNGKISLYATDGFDDAHGYYTDFIIGGDNKTEEVDLSGPEITLYINDTSFIEGDLTSENPKLLVDLFDVSGINTLGNGVGHDLIAILDRNSYNSVLLNDFYVADKDSYQSGRATYHFFSLDEGEHEITVKAWDVFNNSSEKSVRFNVKKDIRLDIDDVSVYPNPSKGEVWFKFKHNLFDGIMNIEIEIYNSTGTLVRVITPGKVTANGYMVKDVKWDGLSSEGRILRNGIYIARVKVLDRNNYSAAHSVKILMAK